MVAGMIKQFVVTNPAGKRKRVYVNKDGNMAEQTKNGKPMTEKFFIEMMEKNGFVISEIEDM